MKPYTFQIRAWSFVYLCQYSVELIAEISQIFFFGTVAFGAIILLEMHLQDATLNYSLENRVQHVEHLVGSASNSVKWLDQRNIKCQLHFMFLFLNSLYKLIPV